MRTPINHFGSITILIAVTGLNMAAPAGILNVPADYATIQGAIDAAVDGDEVLIAPGTYDLTQELIVNNKAITIRGSGGADVTILQASTGLGLYGIMQLSNVESDTVIDGLAFADSSPLVREWVVQFYGSPTIQNCAFYGNTKTALWGTPDPGTTITNCTFTNNHSATSRGGAILMTQDGATISGCTFTNNSAFDRGGAIYLASGTILDCTFESNFTPQSAYGGGGAIYLYYGGVIDNCTFNNNVSAFEGGAIQANLATGTTTISNCDFTNNTAATEGGAVNGIGAAAAALSLIDCTFSGNVATNGLGGGLALDDGVVSGSTFTGNSALHGGGVHLEGAASVDACTFSGNIASGDGGAMYASSGAPSISNCQATNNIATGTGGGLHIAASTTVTMNDSVLCMNTPDQFENVGILLGSNVLACDQPLDPLGACCLDAGGCVMTTATSCAAAGGAYAGDGVECIDAMCPPACPADNSGDGMIDVTDLLDLLAAWGACP
ncbi:MAG: right-handed parallel beta-helix repeat-containing protein [Planctomycetota bacterium]|nr:right-handed parallel beta-helix repeat-containing protein [Planctomycetota bacterium]